MLTPTFCLHFKINKTSYHVRDDFTVQLCQYSTQGFEERIQTELTFNHRLRNLK